MTNHLLRLALPVLQQKDARHPHTCKDGQMYKPIKLPADDKPNCPPMEPVTYPESPFLTRVFDLAQRWVQEEWSTIQSLKAETHRSGRKTALMQAIKDARLTPDNLASRLDNMSRAKLRRALKSLNAPTPIEIIRHCRLNYARHLLTHTFLLVREVAERSGFSDTKHFSVAFMQEFDHLPSDYRRLHIKLGASTSNATARRKPNS